MSVFIGRSKRPSSSPQHGRSAKRTRYGYGKSIKVVVHTGDEPVDDSETFHVPQELLFESDFIRTKTTTQDDEGILVIFNTEPVHFKCFLDWIDHGIPVGAEGLDNGQQNFLSQALNPGADIAYLLKKSARVLNLCCLLILNEFELKHDGFRKEVLEKLHERSESGGKWIFTSLDVFVKLWTVTSPNPRLRNWMKTWDSPSLQREEVDRKSADLDVELVAFLHKIAPPTTLKISFGMTAFPSVHKMNRKQFLRRCPRIVTGDEDTLLINDKFSPNVVSIWFETFKLDQSELLERSKLSISTTKRQTELCQLWKLSEDHGDQKLQKAIVAFFITESKEWVDKGYYKVATQNLMESTDGLSRDCGLRRWFVDAVVASSKSAEWKNPNITYPSGILEDIVARSMEFLQDRTLELRMPGLHDLGTYCPDN